MPFPLRLNADLLFGLVARSLRLGRNPLVAIADGKANTSISSPIVWIGGAGVEALERPDTPGVANALAGVGRHVFVATDGGLLRRRIHEFQPSSRLFLTIRFESAPAFNGAFHTALEGIRAAKLSGFHICGQLVMHASCSVQELAGLLSELKPCGLDGFLISPAGRSAELDLRVAEARNQLLDRRWARLSRLLDAAVLPQSVPTTVPASRDKLVPLPPEGCGEGVHAP
jgi:hypothetical protein